MGRLSGKSAIITGAGSGIGRAASVLFAQEGASLVLADKMDTVHETAKMVTDAGGKAVSVAGDAGDEAFVAGLVAKAVAEYGGLDVAWANAGISGGWTAFDDQDQAFWAEILRVNLIGAFLLVKHAAYSASKAGVISLAQTSANEFYGTGVRVNAICPGLIETGMTQPIFDGARARGNEDKIGQLNPLTRGGVPIEIANAALFLASDEASYVNGQALVVDGGLSSSHPVVRRKR
jgi:NAD(P)-dependent dehydrogenase (short-subunit alcohol dehydrogenase family)